MTHEGTIEKGLEYTNGSDNKMFHVHTIVETTLLLLESNTIVTIPIISIAIVADDHINQ